MAQNFVSGPGVGTERRNRKRRLILAEAYVVCCLQAATEHNSNDRCAGRRPDIRPAVGADI
eukprot:scaffold349080_cov33-Prasinocladus_malaysianus.AAC.1